MGMLRLVVLSLLGLFTATSVAFQVRSSSGLTGISSQTAGPKAATLTPQEVFKRVSPSVFIVEALDSGGKVVAFGSGVVVAPDQIVTNHNVVDKGISVRVRRGQTNWPAKVTHDSPGHDLSRLQVEGLQAAALQVRKSSTLEVGERVYAIGAPEGLELTFSEGVVSALRDFSDGRVIQTTAPISHGSSGGGLFDNQGRLVGITSAGIIEGQNLNFAVPGEWVLALEQSPVLTSLADQSGEAARQALEWLVRCYKLKGEAAVEACKKAIRLKPDYADGWYGLGLTYGVLGQSQQALEAYKEVIRLKPDYADGWYGLGLTYGKFGQLQQALEAYKEVIRLKPDDADGWYGLGLTYGKFGQSQQAFEAYKEAIRLKPDDAYAWHNLGTTYGELGQWQQALEALKEAIRLIPDDAKAWYNLGLSYSNMGQDQQAIEAMREAIRLKPDYAEAWNGLGTIYGRLKQTQRAIEAYREAIRLKPNYTDAWFNLGIEYAIQGNRARVMEVYAQLKLLDPGIANDFFNKVVRP